MFVCLPYIFLPNIMIDELRTHEEKCFTTMTKMTIYLCGESYARERLSGTQVYSYLIVYLYFITVNNKKKLRETERLES
jgi:hypothetical protein